MISVGKKCQEPRLLWDAEFYSLGLSRLSDTGNTPSQRLCSQRLSPFCGGYRGFDYPGDAVASLCYFPERIFQTKKPEPPDPGLCIGGYGCHAGHRHPQLQ